MMPARHDCRRPLAFEPPSRVCLPCRANAHLTRCPQLSVTHAPDKISGEYDGMFPQLSCCWAASATSKSSCRLAFDIQLHCEELHTNMCKQVTVSIRVERHLSGATFFSYSRRRQSSAAQAYETEVQPVGERCRQSKQAVEQGAKAEKALVGPLAPGFRATTRTCTNTNARPGSQACHYQRANRTRHTAEGLPSYWTLQQPGASAASHRVSFIVLHLSSSPAAGAPRSSA